MTDVTRHNLDIRGLHGVHVWNNTKPVWCCPDCSYYYCLVPHTSHLLQRRDALARCEIETTIVHRRGAARTLCLWTRDVRPGRSLLYPTTMHVLQKAANQGVAIP